MSKDGFSYTSNEVDVNKKITIVASKWNAELVNELIESGRIHLESLGFTDLKIVYVPGAWELVHAAQKELVHADGSKDTIVLNHTYNEAQIAWYNEGSALNLIKKENNA